MIFPLTLISYFRHSIFGYNFNVDQMIRKGLIALLAIFSLSGCLRDIEESIDKINGVNKVRWEPAFAAPIIKTRLTINDFLNQTSVAFIEVDPDNLIHVVYRGELVSLEANQVAKFPAKHFTGDINLLPFHINELNTNGSTEVNFSTIFDFGITDTEIDSLIMKVCALKNSLTTDIQHDVRIEVTIPEIKLNGNSLTLVYDLPYDGTGTSSTSLITDLKGAFFDLTKSGNATHSELLTKFKISITKVGNNPIDTDDKISFVSDFLYNEYDVLFGYINEKSISPGGPDSIQFDLFKDVDSNLQNISFTIADPRVKFYITNSYGIPISAKINEFSTYSKSAGKLTATGYPDPLNIPTPTKQQIGEELIDSFELNRSNSNIGDLVSNIPQWMVYDFEATVNPPGTTERNFITYNSRLKMEVDVDIPLQGTADGFVLNSEVDINVFDDLQDVEELDEINLRLFVENDFPVDADLQIYFLDTMGNTLDSLISPNQLFLKSAAVDNNGRIIEPNSYVLDFKIDRARFNRIRDTKKGLVRAALNTYKSGGSQPEVKFFSDYGITVKLGVQAKGTIEVEVE